MGSHYELLGVRREATPAEIRSAYKRKAMELHPDRRGGNAAEFSKVANAYDVLSHPLKRAHYDVFGDASTDELGVVALAVVGTCCCSVIFVMLGVLRFLDWLRTPWAMIFTPLWLLDFALLPILLSGMTSHWSDILISINIGCLIAFTVLLYLQVDGVVDSWTGVLSPLMVSDLLMAISGHGVPYEDLDPCPGWVGALKSVTRSQLYSAAVLGVVGLKLDGIILASWWCVLWVPYIRWSVSLVPSPNSESPLWDLFLLFSLYTLLGSLVASVPWSVSLGTLFLWYVTSFCVFASEVTIPSVVSLPPKTHPTYHTDGHGVTVDID